MFSKSISAYALFNIASATAKAGPKPNAKPFLNEPFDKLMGCGRCLLNGYTYVIDTSTSGIIYGAISDAWNPSSMGRCCKNDNIGKECLDGTKIWDSVNNRLSLLHQKSSAYESRMNALVNCP